MSRGILVTVLSLGTNITELNRVTNHAQRCFAMDNLAADGCADVVRNTMMECLEEDSVQCLHLKRFWILVSLVYSHRFRVSLQKVEKQTGIDVVLPRLRSMVRALLMSEKHPDMQQTTVKDLVLSAGLYICSTI